MPYEDDPTWTSDASDKIGPSKSRYLANSSVLGKRGERSESDKLEKAAKNRKKAKTSQYTGVSLSSSNKRYQTKFFYDGKQVYLGSFKLQADAAKTYDQALHLLRQRNHHWSVPNFANEEEYQAAREKEITERHVQVKSQMTLDSFVKQFTPKFLNETQILAKFGISPKSIPSEESPLTLSSTISANDSHNYQGLLTLDDTVYSDSSDDEADIRKTKKPRISRKTKLPNNCKKSTEDEVINLASSDEEENDETVSRAISDKSVKSSSIRTESISISSSSTSLKVGEGIVESRVVETREANTSQYIVAKYQADNETNTLQDSPTANRTTNENQDDSYLVLKEPLMQILQIQQMTDAMETEITEYCETLHDKGCWNEQHLGCLKGLSEEELEEMLGFMQPLQKEMVKNWVKECREESEGIWI